MWDLLRNIVLDVLHSLSGGWVLFFFFSSRRRHTRFDCDWSSDVCSSDLRLIVQNTLAAVQMLDELRDTAAVMEFVFLDRIDSLISELDGKALVQERQFKIGRASCRERV